MAEAKPVTIKIVATGGGYACYDVNTSIHPSVVLTSEWAVLDWVADKLAKLAFREGAR